MFGVILICPQLIAAQESYDDQAVLDGACPRTFIGRDEDEVLSLRFVPFEKPEVQINIRFREKQAPTINVCQAVDRSILLQFEDLWVADPKSSFADKIAQLNVGRYPVVAPKKFGDKILSELSTVLRETQFWADQMRKARRPKTPFVLLDPDGVEFLYDGKFSALYKAFLSGRPEKWNKKNPPFVSWMYSVRERVEKLSSKKSGARSKH